MEGPIVALIVFLVPSFAFALASVVWGVDSRPLMTDDHRR
jgi:hypothetical protein